MRYLVVAALCLLFALPAFGQVTCIQLGAYTDCSGPNNQSSTQVQLGPNRGAIITDRATAPYTILAPSTEGINPARALSPLPALTPLPTLGGPVTGATIDMLPLFAPSSDGPLLLLGQ